MKLTRSALLLVGLTACPNEGTTVTVAGDCTASVQTDRFGVSIVSHPQIVLPVIVPMPVPYQVIGEKPPVPVPLGSPPCAMNPSITRWTGVLS